jgi:hypothetical protein
MCHLLEDEIFNGDEKWERNDPDGTKLCFGI